jgi:hypothetical protein
MHNLTQTQVDELLRLVAAAVKGYDNSRALAIVQWMRENAQSYLN